MKKYTHAWIACKAIERLEKAPISEPDKKYALSLVHWFKNRKDGVIPGAWYPDEIIKDMAQSHVYKFTPAAAGEHTFMKLPAKSLMYAAGTHAPLYNKSFQIDPNNNLPERCESLAHSVIDNLRVQAVEPKGSPIVPTDNHVALTLFMLSHYAADAHMPLHCDSRQFSEGCNLHGKMEEVWEKQIKLHFDIDATSDRFYFNREGYPLNKGALTYSLSLLKQVEDELDQREFIIDYGTGNKNVREFVAAICQYSYLLSFSFIPQGYDHTNVTTDNWRTLPGQCITLDQLSLFTLTDAIDSVARIWFRVWRRYSQWKEGRNKP